MDGNAQHAAALNNAARRELEVGLAALASGGTPETSQIAPSIAELDALLWTASHHADRDAPGAS